AVYHLAAAGLFGVSASGRPEWWLIVGVAAIAPFVMWRIHRGLLPLWNAHAVERSQEQPQTLTETPSERSAGRSG
ncbi:hypothetical protein KBZ21_47995, partial [Streptomyces sp. A73]|nr:hypothetical protein [Streptomyces sp. A73]